MTLPADVPAAASTTTETSASKLSGPTLPSIKMEAGSLLGLLKTAHDTGDKRMISRVLHRLPTIRRLFQDDHGALSDALEMLVSDDSDLTPIASHYQTDPDRTPVMAAFPEKEAFVSLLKAVFDLDVKNYESGAFVCEHMLGKIYKWNRRTLDPIGARLFFYQGLFAEHLGAFKPTRSALMAALRTSTLRHDQETHAVIYNMLLRNYLSVNDYELADKLIAKSRFPESATNAQLSRYLYYVGQVRAMQLEYSAAHDSLAQAIRKAPQNNKKSAGFLQRAQKLAVIVQLLMGDVPERAVFEQKMLKQPLLPYFKIAHAVRLGDLALFQQTLDRHAAKLGADRTLSLVQRLHQNVIRAGVKRLNQSYMRISLEAIRSKLRLNTVEDAEYIVSKAIRDGVIEATIDHEGGFVRSREVRDVYGTVEPQTAFNQRIQFCQSLYMDALKALRFPEKDRRSTAELKPDEKRPSEEDLIEEYLDQTDDLDF